MEKLSSLLRTLCAVNGVSGDESAVREAIIKEIDGLCEYRTDNLGSLICFKKGSKTPEKKLMICAHMDEVGFIITYIREDGTLAIAPVGGIDPMVAIGRQVRVGSRAIPGVIGSKAVHNLSKEEREKAPDWDNLSIDIGADSREEAEEYVTIGDCAYFLPDFTELGGSRVRSKAIDDRAGCAMMIRMIQEGVEYDTWFVFNVQEEIGLRGSRASAFAVDPDFALVLESTTAADIDGVSGQKRVCALGGGPVVGFMDRSTVYDRELYRLAFDTAEGAGLPCQTKTMIAGGNDAGAIHITRGGIRTLAVSLPCRYLHSASCVIDTADLESSYKLVRLLAEKVHET
jgi:endoglucanase